MSVEFIGWEELFRMYAEYIDTEMSVEAIYPHIKLFAQALDLPFTTVLEDLYNAYRQQ